MVHYFTVVPDYCPYCIDDDSCPDCTPYKSCILTLDDDDIKKFNLFDFIDD